MNGTKNPLVSRTILSALLGIIAISYNTYFQVNITPEQIEQGTDLLVSLWTTVAELIAFVGAIYGRTKATKTIGI